MDRIKWLEERKKGIGGSDCAAIIGKSPYKSNVELWEEKTGRREPEDISNKFHVKYGTEMEPVLRQAFRIKHPEYEIKHQENTIIKHSKYDFLFASLDGEILNKGTGEKGILEIKTSSVIQSVSRAKWKNGIPDNYYCQVLHYLNVTGYDFVELFAELNYGEDYQALKTYTIFRDEVKDDIEYLEKKEIEFWKEYVEKDKRPPTIILNL